MNLSTGWNRKDRFRTIGTSDTYDVNQTDPWFTNENVRRNGSIRRGSSKHRKQHGSQGKDLMKEIGVVHRMSQSRHNKSLHSAIMGGMEATPKLKIRRLMSSTQQDKGLRVRTDYSQRTCPYSLKKIVNELKKGIQG
jgi:hypothetical protein